MIESWNDFSEKIKEVAEFETGLIFRGVSDESFSLMPSIARKDIYGTVNLQKLTYDSAWEAKLYERFEREMRPFVDQHPKSKLEVLAVAQHHGLPTRLLDWTENLLVATYFAVKEAGLRKIGDEYQKVNAALYVAALPEAAEVEPGSYRDSQEREITSYHPPHIASRIPAQSGLFTLHGTPEAPWKTTDQGGLGGGKVFKYVISSDACNEIKPILSKLGIHAASLFPDLDGLCENLFYRNKFGDL